MMLLVFFNGGQFLFEAVLMQLPYLIPVIALSTHQMPNHLFLLQLQLLQSLLFLHNAPEEFRRGVLSQSLLLQQLLLLPYL